MNANLLDSITSEADLAALAVKLGASSALPLALDLPVKPSDNRFSPTFLAQVKAEILAGRDPLGDIFTRLRNAATRREKGATYTPDFIVDSMVAWAKLNANPTRIVDIGAGSARFSLAAGKAFPKAALALVEIDPLAALLARTNLTVRGFAKRSRIIIGDYRDIQLPNEPTSGEVLFIGNPPYVRHHLIDARWKAWLSESAKKYGYAASQLAGLHVYFILRTLQIAKPGDKGVLITAAEWLDVNYGRIVRDLFVHQLGGKSIHLIDATAAPFPDAQTTAVITAFEVGSASPSVRMKRVEKVADLGVLNGGKPIKRARLEAAGRWGPFFRLTKKTPDGFVELGELCSVHRGAVTGANHIWIAGEHSVGLPESVLFASVTKARELIAAGSTLADPAPLRRVIDLPVELDVFDSEDRKRIDRFLKKARLMGADKGFIATHRRAWWSVGLRPPAPILTTYMARRAPAFVRNEADARHINIAHGIYPREPMSDAVMDRLVSHLSTSVSTASGRTYAGGLTKFEPGEMERLLVPALLTLEGRA